MKEADFFEGNVTDLMPKLQLRAGDPEKDRSKSALKLYMSFWLQMFRFILLTWLVWMIPLKKKKGEKKKTRTCKSHTEPRIIGPSPRRG